jgi:hypothetical protein
VRVRRAALLALAAGVAAAAWRRRAGRRERVAVHFADGSMVVFEAGSAEAERLLPLARNVLAHARG